MLKKINLLNLILFFCSLGKVYANSGSIVLNSNNFFSNLLNIWVKNFSINSKFPFFPEEEAIFLGFELKEGADYRSAFAEYFDIQIRNSGNDPEMLMSLMNRLLEGIEILFELENKSSSEPILSGLFVLVICANLEKKIASFSVLQGEQIVLYNNLLAMVYETKAFDLVEKWYQPLLISLRILFHHHYSYLGKRNE
jgi:hypothetical protein